MTARELLGVVVRLAGLASIVASLFDLYYVIVKTLGIQTASQVPVERDVRGFLLYLIFGVAIVAGAKLIVRLAYWSGADA